MKTETFQFIVNQHERLPKFHQETRFSIFIIQ